MSMLKTIFQIRLCIMVPFSFMLILLHPDFSLSTDLTLAWDANRERDLAGYKIYYLTKVPDGWSDGTGLAQGASPITIHLSALETITSPFFRLSNLTAGESYHFSVTAFNKTGKESDFSNLVRYDVPVPVTHPLTASTIGHGDISPTGTVNVTEGSDQTFVIKADQGHHIKNVIIDGVSMGPISSYTFEDIHSPHAVQAIFAVDTISFTPPLKGSEVIDSENVSEDTVSVEIGEVIVNNNWQHVEFNRTFIHPVVVASALSNNDDEPAVVRIDNITDTGFEISVQEWDYLDDDHLYETIGYIVVEAGSHTLPDGTRVEAGTFIADGTAFFTSVLFTGKFNQVPVIVSSVASNNDQDAVATRIQNITSTQFEARIQEQQANTGEGHSPETVTYVAWEPCKIQQDGLIIEIAKTDDMIANDFETITFDSIFPIAPIFIATMQTTDGSDAAALRWDERSTSSIQIKVEEEQSFDPETRHTSEVIGFFTFSSDTIASTD